MTETVTGQASIKKVSRGGFAAFIIYTIGIGLTYCSQLLIARLVGAETFGIYTYVYSWMVVLAYLSALGFDVALLRFVPAYRAQDSWGLARGVIQYAERRAAILGALVVGAGGTVALAWTGASSPQLTKTFIVGFILVPIWALLWIRCSVVRTFGSVVSALTPDRLVRDGLLLAIVGVASLGLNWSFDATSVMAVTVVSSAVGLGLVSLSMRRLRPQAMADTPPVYAAPLWRQTALPLVVIAATEVAINRTGVLLLGWLGNTKDAGIYGLAFNIAFVIALPRIAINTLFAPAISNFFTRKDNAMLQALITRATSWTLGGGATIALILAVFAEPLMTWFGPEYRDGVTTLRILLLGQVTVSGAGSQLYIMTMTGHERSAAGLLLASGIANAIVSFVLIHVFGLSGAAIATMLTMIAWNLVMSLFIWRNLRLLPGMIALFHGPSQRSVDIDCGNMCRQPRFSSQQSH